MEGFVCLYGLLQTELLKIVQYFTALHYFCLIIAKLYSTCVISLWEVWWAVLRTFTKRLTGTHSLPYTDHLKALGLERLELRRLHADLIMCYKIVNRV